MAVIHTLLIANRGEIAVRIARSAAEMGIATVAAYASDEAESLHVRLAERKIALPAAGPKAYLDIAAVIQAARDSGCDGLHPGYGFLAENSALAAACAEADLTFVGPTTEMLALFGDKARARMLARDVGVPVLRGTGAVSLAEAEEFLDSLGGSGAIMLKAVAGGGGRGMRPVRSRFELADAYARCASEAQAAFGDAALYAEEFLPHARHIEVQIAGDGSELVHLWDRECSLQRQRQKLIEFAPVLGLDQGLRDQILTAAVRLGRAAHYRNLGTMEFLVQPDEGRFAFIEANARLQVEHTVTEEITGLDLVRLQLEIASGRSLRELGLDPQHPVGILGIALQARINMETMQPDGTARPESGVITRYEPAAGPGIRIDGMGYSGYRTSTRYDALLAKLIVHSRSVNFDALIARALRALREFAIEGVRTNVAFLQALLSHQALATLNIDTQFVDSHIGELLASVPQNASAHATDPLAVLFAETSVTARTQTAPPGTTSIDAPLQGSVVVVTAEPDTAVLKGQTVLVLEAMKMEHPVPAPASGYLRAILVEPGQTVFQGDLLGFIEEAEFEARDVGATTQTSLDHIRSDLEELFARRQLTQDAARPQAVLRRRQSSQRTARENIEDLCDKDSFTEFGSLVIAGQLRRRSQRDLIEKTPADGLICGLGRVNGQYFDDARARVIAMSYDYTVLAGTQGMRNHQKTDRMLHLARDWRLPIVFFTAGGGGRPGDTDMMSAGGLNVTTFQQYARLSGLVPLVGVNSGYCFAGNAALLGCCDVIIATRNSSIGMGGPAMIEGGGLGVFRPEDVGPATVQAANGVIDVLVEDESEATATAKKYLAFFQGPLAQWSAADQRALRHLVPENRLRVYDVRSIIETMCDSGSVLELRRQFGNGMVTAFGRIEGRPLGIIANHPAHLGGAIDRDGADKAARFMQLCEAFDLPIVMLCDTPGNMVGPEAEKTALVRHNSRLFLIGANLSVPLFTVILRKGYGLGAQAMAGASFVAPFFTVSWPSGEFGGMGLEGAVKLGYRNELAAISDPVARKAKYDEMVARMYERGKALSAASLFEFDEVIDPADTRRWIMAGLRALPPLAERTGKKLRWIDAW